MTDVDGGRIFRLSLKLSTETLNEAAPEIEGQGFEPKAFFVLDGIEAQPSPAELARQLSMPKPTLTAYLKNLEARGYVKRSIDTRDLRRHRLELTPAGAEALAQARGALLRRYGERLVRLSDAEKTTLAALLEKLTG
ncbi:MarR family transcriptional regulator [Paroceanicella profunda]|uniref:MarR family transcriptional regulator n=1 Tax=Paroceanicella profunda TaxID=2579971 RepID=A0A5B8FIG3_9RHOB|nr:MarR family transcriptional regulator [Paroceanicella profunda]QDL93217.1 MarR family transcriptional regulator [Paroceanicella profunda]